MFAAEDNHYFLVTEIFNLLSIQNHLIEQLKDVGDVEATSVSIIDLQSQIEEAVRLLNWINVEGSPTFTVH